ncbi:MAG: tRNA 2-thiouridine(34) synthase MnmA [Candidatus Marinimicrobia bacterium]|nr:tRNA 2-thiouridine(34) synthase MnmA [Candidatus Neomarinimicrobiota bacterium]
MNKTTDNCQVLLAMSGGVDSSVAAFVLKEQGYQPEGVTFKLWCHGSDNRYPEIIQRAQSVCSKLEIKHHVLDIEKEFKETVVQQFADDYLSGITPNPCVFCNRFIKWRHLLATADRLGIPYVATGHYVRLEKNADGYHEILKGVDPSKDQSYMLWQLSQEALRRTLFPLGSRLKNDIKAIADNLCLHDGEQKESQDVCFLPDNDYREFLQSYCPERIAEISQGELVNDNLQVLGFHNGFHNFTIGQRKGFKKGFSKRKYVKEIDAANNRVMITDNEQLFSRQMTIRDVNWVGAPPANRIEGIVKIRYNHKGVQSQVSAIDKNRYLVEFSEPQRAVTPGQSAVLYLNDRLILGGIIVGGDKPNYQEIKHV